MSEEQVSIRGEPLGKKVMAFGVPPFAGTAAYLWGTAQSSAGIELIDLLVAALIWAWISVVVLFGYRLGLKAKNRSKQS